MQLRFKNEYYKGCSLFIMVFQKMIHTSFSKLLSKNFKENKYGNILSENLKIVHINLEELANMWYSEVYKSYSKQTQQLCALASLMMETNRKKFEENLKKVPLEEKIKESMERIVWNMNDDEEIIERYYDRDEEYERIKRSYINGEKKRARKEGLEEGRTLGIKQGMKQGVRQGMRQGMKQGVRQGIINTTKKLLQNHVDIQIISNATGLSIEEINAIEF